jgi:hypothetical protein
MAAAWPRRCIAPLLGLVAAAAGCVHTFHMVRAEGITPPEQDTLRVRTPVRAHLLDGSIVTFRSGLLVSPDSLLGYGVRFSLSRRDSSAIDRLAMDSVVGLEAYYTDTDQIGSFVVSTLATAAIIVGTVASAILISCIGDPKCFGSCPTFYAIEDSAYVLESEGFSYSIVPLFEARDVDRLGARADSMGVLRLELRNEALETHYINHIELLDVAHNENESVLPDERGRPVAVVGLQAPATARDGSGRNIRDVIAGVDGQAFATDSARLASVTADSLDDAVELTFAPPTSDSAALILRVRNSLLNTVLLYGEMLESPGPRAIDWMAEELSSIGAAATFGHWYRARMGMRIAVWTGTGWRAIARVPDAGPLAWKDVAVIIPSVGTDSLRVRLSFVADQWRIDRVALASSVRRPSVRVVPITEVIDAHGEITGDAQQALAEPDEHYLETVAGQRATLRFDVGHRPEVGSRTFLLGTQGYYTEWLRQAWLRTGSGGQPFTPTDEALARTIERYRSIKPELEAHFHATRIPVR